MQQHGCCPDVVTYNMLLDGLCRAGKVETAWNFLSGMNSRGGEIAPNVVLICGYCGCGDVDKAVELLDEMHEAGLKPDKITHNTLVKGLCEAQRMYLVKEVLKPDTCTFNTLMVAHCSSGSVNYAVKVFDRMLQLHVKTDSASYSTLICGLCKSGELVDELLEKEVLGRRGVCVPLMAAYNLIFAHCCQKDGMLPRQLVEKRATMDIAAFKTVILGYCREGEVREGFKLLVTMVRSNLMPDLEAFEALIEGFLADESSRKCTTHAKQDLKNSDSAHCTSPFSLQIAIPSGMEMYHHHMSTNVLQDNLPEKCSHKKLTLVSPF